MVFLPIHFKNSNVISEKKGGNETFISIKIKIILILKETMRKKQRIMYQLIQFINYSSLFTSSKP